jgi:hypothetical protein
MEWRCVTSAFSNTELFEDSMHTADILLKIITKDESWDFACDPLNDTNTSPEREIWLTKFQHKINA